MAETCEACVLAGGRSSRMGRDKARLRLGGRSLLAHVRAAARQAGLPVRIIRRDLRPGCGPLGGVYTGLHTSRAEAVLFLSCDMPFVNAGLLDSLRSHLTAGVEAVFVIHQRRVSFPFLIRRGALTVVESLLSKRQLALQTLARRLGGVRLGLSPDQRHCLFNINTPDEYAFARNLRKRLGEIDPAGSFNRRLLGKKE